MKIKETLTPLASLFWSFIKIGTLTFGGGAAMLPILQHEVINRRGWVEEKDVVDYFAIGQSTPGIIAVNVAAFVGHRVAGVCGAIAASLAVVIPSIIVILLIAKFIAPFSQIAWVRKVMHGINVAVAVILVRAVYSFARTTVIDKITLTIAILAFAGLYIFNIAGVWIVAAAAVIGLLCAPRSKNGGIKP